jgi:hypothetical protein
MIFILIQIEFEIDIKNDELLNTIWEHKKGKKKVDHHLVVSSNAKPKYQAMQMFLNTHILLEFKHYFEVTHNGKYILCIKFSQFDSIENLCKNQTTHSLESRSQNLMPLV